MRNNCARLAVVAGGRSFDGAAFDFALARYNPDGSLDATLDGDGKLATAIGSSDDFATSIAIQSDGKIVAGGYSDDGATFALARYDSGAPTHHLLTVDKTGTGTGTVTSPDLGIDCGDDCASQLPQSSYGTLAAVPDEGSEFSGWSGPCLGDAGDEVNECTIRLISDQAVTATFDDVPDPEIVEHARALEVTKFGHGKSDGERVLVVKGVLMATDGFTSCTSAQELTLQRKRDGLFIDKVAGTTAADGSFRFAVPDRRGTYRVMVPASMFPSDGTPTDSCSATQQAMRHRH